MNSTNTSTNTQSTISSIEEAKARIKLEKLGKTTNWQSVKIQDSTNKSQVKEEMICVRELEECMDDESPLVQIEVNAYIKISKIASLNSYIGIGINCIVTRELLYGFIVEFYEYGLIPSDIIGVISQFCESLKVLSIRLDRDNIVQQHKLFANLQENANHVDLYSFDPFLLKLEITNFEFGEPLSVQTDWECDDYDNDDE